MGNIKIRPEDLGKEIKARFASMPAAIAGGAYLGAMQGQAILAKRTPRFKGRAAAGWRARRGNKTLRVLASVENDAPYVGILETGARPHPVSIEGKRAIARWAKAKFGVDRPEANRIANAIAWKISKKGQKPTYFVRDSREDLANAVASNVAFVINTNAGRRVT